MFSKASYPIPSDINPLIFEHLDSLDIYNMRLVDKAGWELLSKDQTFWKKQYKIYFPHGLELTERLEPTTAHPDSTHYWFLAFLRDFKRDWLALSFNTSVFRLFAKVKQTKPLQEDEIKEMFESELPKTIKAFESKKIDFYAIRDGSGLFYQNNLGFNSQIIKHFRKMHIDVMSRNPNRTFLDWAYINKHQQVLDEIFKQRAKFQKDADEQTTQELEKTFSNIKLAVICNQISILQNILTNFALDDEKKSSLLDKIAKLGAIEILEALIKWNIITIDEIQNKHSLCFPLWEQAVKYGNEELIIFLLKKQLPFNQDTLMIAIFYGHYSIANILIEKIKSLPNLPNNELCQQRGSYYAINAAITLNDKQSLRNLLDAKIFNNLNFHPKGSKTCLGLAAYYGNNNDNEILKALINAGADPNQAGSYRRSNLIEQKETPPIEKVIKNCNYEALRFLLRQDHIEFADNIIKCIKPSSAHPDYDKKGQWCNHNIFYSKNELEKTREPVESLVRLMSYTKRIKNESSWNIGTFLQKHALFEYTDKILKKEISQILLDCISGKEDISKLSLIDKDPVKSRVLHDGRLGKIYKSLFSSIEKIKEANNTQNTENNNQEKKLF